MNGFFYTEGTNGHFWSSSKDASGVLSQTPAAGYLEPAWIRSLDSEAEEVRRSHAPPVFGFSVRCLQDEPKDAAEVDLPRKDFSESFKQGFIESCLKEGWKLPVADANEYCNCSLLQLINFWDSEEDASREMGVMSKTEVWRLLVGPCLK